MGAFRDLLDEITQKILDESPKRMDSISYTKLRNEIQKKLDYYGFDINDEDSYEKIGDNVYVFGALDGNNLLGGYDFILYIENNQILGAAMLKHITINTEHNKANAHEIIYTTNFTKTPVKGLLYKLYSAYSKHFNAYIVSGNIQSPESEKIWARWLREKVNIKEIFGYHYKEKKYLHYKQISNYWGASDKMQERRIVVKFR